ncbi:hypothetical protein C0V97_08345 [Asaia sp. W19]|nr:hypothetical protein C0V97_08345 [Asaia sp. W19]
MRCKMTSSSDSRYANVFLNGETWVASNVNGKTVYISGSTVVDGPVVLAASTTLIVQSGAVVSGLLAAGAVGSPTISVMNGGQLIDSVVNTGTVSVAAGGLTANNDFNGNTLTYASGAKSENDVFYATTGKSGTVTVQNGASVSGAQITSNMTLSAAAGASLSQIVVGSGGSVISAGAPVSSSTSNVTLNPSVQNHNTMNTGGSITGGDWIAVNIGGTTYYQSGTAKLTGPVFLTNATLTITSGAVVDGMLQAQLGNPTITIQSGGVLTHSTLNNGYVTVQNGGVMSGNYGNSAQVTVSSGGKSINDTFYTTYGGNDTVTVLSGATISGPSLSNTTLVVSSGASLIEPVNIGSGGAATIYGTAEACFLPGTMIATPMGEVAIETLAVGDEIITLEPGTGNAVTQRVTWVGKGRTITNGSAYDDLAGYPVCVAKDAIATGVPHRDVYLTAEHCLYVDGHLVPVRTLVNGGSIYYDTSRTDYEYFHLATEKHSVILADGMPSETYRDTGNARAFSQHGKLARLSYPQMSCSSLSLCTDLAFLETLYNRISSRSGNQPSAQQARVLTNERDVRLITPSGQVVRALRASANHIVFRLPPQIQSVRIASNACRPCDAIGPFHDDRRQLGVLVGAITLFDASDMRSLDAHLGDEASRGWHESETADARWTDGYALIALPGSTGDGERILSIEIRAGGPYVAETTTALAVAC